MGSWSMGTVGPERGYGGNTITECYPSGTQHELSVALHGMTRVVPVLML